MPYSLKELTEEALRLPQDERVILAESLLLTINEAYDQVIDDATMTELERRLHDLRTGSVTAIPADKALRELRESLKRAS